MRKFMINLIDLYKLRTKDKNPTCRFHPSCSSYSRQAYEKHNFFYASILSFWRILRCNPFNKGGFNPVPKTRKEKKEHELSEH